MEFTLSLTQQILGMALMALAGYVLGKKNLITPEQSRVLSAFNVYVVMPCSLINAYSCNRDMSKLGSLAISMLCSILLRLMFVAVSYLMSKAGFTKEERASVVYINAGNLIMPMVQNIFGPSYIIYNSPYLLLQDLLMWTHGCKVMGNDEKLTLRKVVLNPVIAGMEIGVILFATGLHLPGPVQTAVSGMAACLAPVGMLVTGIVMSSLDLKAVFSHKRSYLVAAFRLLVIPLLSMPLLLLAVRLFPDAETKRALVVLLLCVCGPSATVLTQQAVLYRNPQAGYVTAINAVTTLCCVVTMPLMSMIFRSLI